MSGQLIFFQMLDKLLVLAQDKVNGLKVYHRYHDVREAMDRHDELVVSCDLASEVGKLAGHERPTLHLCTLSQKYRRSNFMPWVRCRSTSNDYAT